jgi:hypothetical protein
MGFNDLRIISAPHAVVKAISLRIGHDQSCKFYIQNGQTRSCAGELDLA